MRDRRASQGNGVSGPRWTRPTPSVYSKSNPGPGKAPYDRRPRKTGNPPVLSTLDHRGVLTIELNRGGDPQRLRRIFPWKSSCGPSRERPEGRTFASCCSPGGGPFSCAGGTSAGWRPWEPPVPEERLRAARQIVDVLMAIRRCSHPVVCAVHGAAIAGASGWWRPATWSWRPADPVRPERGPVGNWFPPALPAAFGPDWGRAHPAAFLTGQRIDAADRYRVGLVDYLVSKGTTLEDAAEERVRQMLLCGPQALSQAKRLVSELSSEESVLSGATLAARVRRWPSFGVPTKAGKGWRPTWRIVPPAWS